MKPRVVVFFCLAIISIQGFSQWRWLQPTPQGNGLFKIQFTDSLTGYTCGGYGNILKTTDGGASWFILDDSQYSLITCMTFISTQKGFITYHGIKETDDGGVSWNSIPVPGTSLIRQIQFVDALHGFAAADSAFYVTCDGGATWQSRTPTGIYVMGMFFTDALNGYINTWTHTKKTTDGGFTWLPGNLNTSESLAGIWFFDPQEGFIIGQLGHIYKTTNGGANWETVPSPTNQNLFGIKFISSDTGYIVGEGCILKTTDKGLNWLVTNSDSQSYYDVSFKNSQKGIAVGGFGIIEKTDDGGNNWVLTNTKTTGTLSRVSFPDHSHGFVMGMVELLRTKDYGNSWEILNTPAGRTMYDICFTDTLTGYVGSDSGYILKTQNGGDSWQASQIGPPNHAIMAVKFINSDTGYFGSQGTIGKTTDAGVTWTTTNIPWGQPISCFSFPSPMLGYAGSTDWTGAFLKTTNGGITWNLLSYGFECHGFTFLDSLNGYYLNHDPGLMKTVDGGNTWQPINIPTWDPTALQFLNKDTGYITSWYDVIRTTDGGASFDVVTPFTHNKFMSLFFLDADTGYVTGDGGMIMKTNNGGIVTGIASVIPTQKKLLIYPNPACGYVIVKIDEVDHPGTISILDLIGRHIQSLPLPASAVEKRIDVSSLKPGYYILRIVKGSKPKIGKLLIL